MSESNNKDVIHFFYKKLLYILYLLRINLQYFINIFNIKSHENEKKGKRQQIFLNSKWIDTEAAILGIGLINI